MRRHKLQTGLIVTLGILAIGATYLQKSQATTRGKATSAASVSLSTNKQQFAPGETIFITVINHGRSTIDFTADPAFRVFQSDREIYAPIASLGQNQTPARQLTPNQPVSWEWDQYTLRGQAPAGEYTIRVTYLNGSQLETIKSTITIER